MKDTLIDMLGCLPPDTRERVGSNLYENLSSYHASDLPPLWFAVSCKICTDKSDVLQMCSDGKEKTSTEFTVGHFRQIAPCNSSFPNKATDDFFDKMANDGCCTTENAIKHLRLAVIKRMPAVFEGLALLLYFAYLSP